MDGTAPTWLGILVNGGLASVALVLAFLLYKINESHSRQVDKFLAIIAASDAKLDSFKDAVNKLSDQLEKLANNNGNIADVLSTNGAIINKFFLEKDK